VRIYYPEFNREELIERITVRLKTLCRHLPLKRVILFGSWARGRATAASDIDLLIIYEGSRREEAYSLCWDIIDIPQLELHIYTEEEYERLKASGSHLPREAERGINLWPDPPRGKNERERVLEIIRRLRAEYPDVKGTALKWETPLDLLVATILSAQTTDEKVNRVTEHLFKKYRTARDYAEAPLEELEAEISSLTFYRQKARFIKEACKTLVEEYGGEVPRSMEELLKLKGVARKTANIVLSNAYGINEGIAVDTHVARLSRRLGLTQEKNRNKIERDLMELIPQELWFDFTNLIIEHGRRICKARKPRCDECVIRDLCPSAEVREETS